VGAGLPSAIAAAVIHPDRRVLAVCGDGGFMMNSQELGTAVRMKLNLVVLVREDRAYGMIRWKQEVDGFSDFGLDFGNPDFVADAKSYGARSSRVGKVSELVTMLESCIQRRRSASRCGDHRLQREHARTCQRVTSGSPGQVKSPPSILCAKVYFLSRRVAEFVPKPTMTNDRFWRILLQKSKIEQP
jgi:thiamine pyrophosphate-dependent acetolactate synthase large subunit-like protein